jgi:hypothetical protein
MEDAGTKEEFESGSQEVLALVDQLRNLGVDQIAIADGVIRIAPTISTILSVPNKGSTTPERTGVTISMVNRNGALIFVLRLGDSYETNAQKGNAYGFVGNRKPGTKNVDLFDETEHPVYPLIIGLLKEAIDTQKGTEVKSRIKRLSRKIHAALVTPPPINN